MKDAYEKRNSVRNKRSTKDDVEMETYPMKDAK